MFMCVKLVYYRAEKWRSRETAKLLFGGIYPIIFLEYSFIFWKRAFKNQSNFWIITHLKLLMLHRKYMTMNFSNTKLKSEKLNKLNFQGIYPILKYSKACFSEVYYVTQVLKQGINTKTMCPNYILKFRNTKSHLLQVYVGTLANIETVIKHHVC